MARRKGKRRRSAKQRAATRRMLAGLRRKRHKKHGSTHHRKRKGYHHMAKRRKRRGGGKRRHSSGRRRRFGGGRGLGLIKHDVPDMLAAIAYGKVEAMAAADDSFILNKIPRPIAAVGYTGNIALALYVANMIFPHRYLRMGARTAATIAAYKIGKQGKLYTSSDKTTIGEPWYGNQMDGGVEHVIDHHTMGALDAEATEFAARPPTHGIPYDSTVEEAGSHV
jgi:hypothetical protein